MTRSVRAGGLAAALLATLFGTAPAVQAQIAPAATVAAPIQQALSVQPSVAVAEAVARPASPSVFGTVPLPLRIQPTGTRWARIMNAPLSQPGLARLTRNAGGLSPREQVEFVQSAVNRAVRVGSSSNDCADDGYWAAADETLARGVGDCVDIAIAKMEALRLLGIPQKDLYLTTGYVGGNGEIGKGRESAALLVRIGEGFWLLPERSEHIVAAGTTAGSFAPIVTYGVGANWVHGRRKAAG